MKTRAHRALDSLVIQGNDDRGREIAQLRVYSQDDADQIAAQAMGWACQNARKPSPALLKMAKELVAWGEQEE